MTTIYPSDPKSTNKYPNIFVATLAGSLALGGTETSIKLSSIRTLDGQDLDTANFKFTGRGVLSVDVQSVPRAEFISFTGIDVLNKKLTGAIRGLSFVDDSVIPQNKKFHAVGAPVVIAFGTHNLRDIEKLLANAGPENTGLVRLLNSPNLVLGNPTISIGTPAIATLNNHGLKVGDQIIFTTTGTLPTGITAGDVYYVSATNLTTNTFKFGTRLDDDLYLVNTTGTQSGVHTLTRVTPYVNAGHIIQDGGVDQPTEPKLNFRNYFTLGDTPGVSNDVDIDIDELTSDSTFQTNVNNFVTGGSSIALTQYQFDDTVSGVPSTGFFTTNNATPASVTQINVNNLDGLSIDHASEFSTFTVGDKINLTDTTNPGLYATYIIVSITNTGTETDFVVTYDSSVGTFTDNDNVTITLIRTAVSNSGKILVDGSDTTPDYLDPKINIHSSDSSVSVTKTILNPGANEVLDVDLKTTGGGGSGSGTPITVQDEFYGLGITATGTNAQVVGELEWRADDSNSATFPVTAIDGETGHSGIVRLTSATTGGGASMTLGETSKNPISNIMKDGSIYHAILRPQYIDAYTGGILIPQINFQVTPGWGSWTNDIRFILTKATGNITFLTSDGTDEITNLGAYTLTDWYDVTFKVVGLSVQCWLGVNGVTPTLVATHSTHIPTSVPGVVGFEAIEATQVDIDYFSMYDPTANAKVNQGGGGITEVFNSSGTWNKPAGAKSVQVITIGGGGGGASGTANVAGQNSSGGSGGGGGAVSTIILDASNLGATETVTVGVGGTGGVGVDGTVSNSPGNPGGDGTLSSFGTWIKAGGGGGGISSPLSGIGGGDYAGGGGASVINSATSVTGGVPAASGNSLSGQGSTVAVNVNGGNSEYGGASGGGTRAGGLNNGKAGGSSIYAAPGGGGGGGADSLGNEASGGDGGTVQSYTSGGGGAGGIGGGGGAGNPGANGLDNSVLLKGYTGEGGGGGSGSSADNGGTGGGAGGNGGFPGGGAGGGGGVSDSTFPYPLVSGAGGDGADGQVIVITTF